MHEYAYRLDINCLLRRVLQVQPTGNEGDAYFLKVHSD